MNRRIEQIGRQQGVSVSAIVAMIMVSGMAQAENQQVREFSDGVFETSHRVMEEALYHDAAPQVLNITAIVQFADATPAEGAVVVTSAGGHAVSNSEGKANLTIEVNPLVDLLHVTAVSTFEAVNYVGSKAMSTLRCGSTEPIVITLNKGKDCNPAWIPTFGMQPGVDNYASAFAVFDDGSGNGPALYVGGGFTMAGAVIANHVAKWDGEKWSALGSGVSGVVRALAAFDDGSGNGPALYAGGHFTSAGGLMANRIARWDGTEWSAVGGGTNGVVEVLQVFDTGNGDGPALFVGGRFTTAGAISANYIAKWDGHDWSALDNGMGGATLPWVLSMVPFDDGLGQGEALFVGGQFTTAGNIDANRIARWDGQEWSSLGEGVSGCVGFNCVTHVSALAVFNEGTGDGPTLFAGGGFTSAGSVGARHIARWNGDEWSEVGPGVLSSQVRSLAVSDDSQGTGSALYVGGSLTSISGMPVNRIAKWDGNAWHALDGGIPGGSSVVLALAVFKPESSDGPAVFVGGSFDSVGGFHGARNMGVWNGQEWSHVGTGIGGCVGGGNCTPQVRSLAAFDDGSGFGPALYAGGNFKSAGSGAISGVAKWNGLEWQSVGGGINGSVYALTVFDSGSSHGPALYAGGAFGNAGGVSASRIAKWDGSEWSALGSGVNGDVWALAPAHGDAEVEPGLYVGGSFTTAGGMSANRIARWDGTSWSTLGNGMNHEVRALRVLDDGKESGPVLYAGGRFTTAGGIDASLIAKWDGQKWSALGSGLHQSGSRTVQDLAIFDDGTGGGPAIYVAGDFASTGDLQLELKNIAKWDGREWHAIGVGLSHAALALAVFNDGEGDALYVGGNFSQAGGVFVNRLAKWDGQQWSALSSEIVAPNLFGVLGLLAFDEASSQSLIVAGNFSTSPGGDSFIARWSGCPLASRQIQFAIRPGSCPNPLNRNSQGVIPTAILGMDDFHVSSIDTDTLVLRRADGVGGSIAPLNGRPGPGMTFEDVGSPIGDTAECACHEEGPDGIEDIALKFRIQETVAALELDDLLPGQPLELVIEGELFDGTPISGKDCVVLVGGGNVQHVLTLLSHWGACDAPLDCPADLNNDGVVNTSDLLILLANWG